MAATSQLTRILCVMFVRLQAAGGGLDSGWNHSGRKINNNLTGCIAESRVDRCTNAFG